MKERKAHNWDRQKDNWYVEPEWCSSRLFDVEDFKGRICDPAAGGGNIVKSALAAGFNARGFDIIDRGAPNTTPGRNFITGDGYRHGELDIDNIVSNPPYGREAGAEFRYEEQFLLEALRIAKGKVALFLHASWMSSGKRGEWLEGLPLCRVHLLGPRPSCPTGEFLAEGGKASGGVKDFAWYVFMTGFQGAPTIHWLRRDG